MAKAGFCQPSSTRRLGTVVTGQADIADFWILKPPVSREMRSAVLRMVVHEDEFVILVQSPKTARRRSFHTAMFSASLKNGVITLTFAMLRHYLIDRNSRGMPATGSQQHGFDTRDPPPYVSQLIDNA